MVILFNEHHQLSVIPINAQQCYCKNRMAAKPAGVALGTPVQPINMDLGGPTQTAVQMDLKALLESHIVEQPLESAFHG